MQRLGNKKKIKEEIFIHQWKGRCLKYLVKIGKMQDIAIQEMLVANEEIEVWSQLYGFRVNSKSPMNTMD